MLVSFLLPGGLLVMAAIILAASGLAAEAAPPVLALVPTGIWVVGILLGWRFNRSRLVFALIVLALADRALWHLAASAEGDLVRQTAALLVPLNLLIIFLRQERGVVSGRGCWLLLFILFQLMMAAVSILSLPERTASLLNHQLRPDLGWEMPLPQLAMLAWGTALLSFCFLLLRRRRALENGFFWAAVAAAGAFGVSPGLLSTIFLSTAGLVLMVTVVETAYGMAFRDDLTGLPARRALNESLLQLGHKYTLAMVDIDFFKKFNDQYGHEVGDQVLCMVAAKLSGVTGGGKAFRYGGEEFTIIFPGKSGRDVLPHLESLRETIAGAAFIIRGKDRPLLKPRKKSGKGGRQKVNVTVSIGMASANGATSPQKVLKAADQALYRAKKNGRNQVAA